MRECAQLTLTKRFCFREGYKGPAKLSKNYGFKIMQAAIYIAILYGLLWILAVPMGMKFVQSILNVLPWHSFK